MQKSSKKDRKKEKYQKNIVRNNNRQQDDGPGQLDDQKITSKDYLRRMSAAEQTQLINDIAEKIVYQPEKHIKHASTVLTLMKSESLMTVNVAIDALATIFTSIGPIQTPEQPQPQPKFSKHQHKLKKVEYELRTFEKTVVESYERYVELLKELSKSLKKELFSNNQEVFVKFKNVLVKSACKCLSSLWNSPGSKPLVGLLSKYSKSKIVHQLFGQILSDKNPAILQMKLQIIKQISNKIVKKNEKTLADNLVALLNLTQIDSTHLDKDDKSKKYLKKKEKHKMYKEKELQRKKNAEKDPLQLEKERKQMKKHQKEQVRQEVNKQFQEGELQVDHKRIVRLNSQILHELFYLYFKILMKKSHSIFLKDSLDGMLKFSHLINTELIRALIQNLTSSAQALPLQWQSTKDIRFIQSGLHIIFTAESIINGPASIFNMADHKQSIGFYRILRDINQTKSIIKFTPETFRMVLLVIDQMMFRKRQLSVEVVASVAREAAILAKRSEAPKLALLEVLRMLVNKYSKIMRMFEEDNEGFGINSYNPAVEDPQASNSINTSLLDILAEVRKVTKDKEEMSLIDKLTTRSFVADKVFEIKTLLDKHLK